MWQYVKLFLLVFVLVGCIDSVVLAIRRGSEKKKPIAPALVKWFALALILAYRPEPWVVGACIYGVVAGVTEFPDTIEKSVNMVIEVVTGAVVMLGASQVLEYTKMNI